MRRPAPLLAFRRRYGANPVHLIAHLAAFAIAAFALDRIVSSGSAMLLAGWYLGLIVAHDLIFVPVYSGLDRMAQRRLPARRGARVPIINHVRAPAFISGLLLLIYAPLISGLAGPYYLSLSGHHLVDYLRNWLALSVALFAGSAVIYGLRVWRAAAGASDRPSAR